MYLIIFSDTSRKRFPYERGCRQLRQAESILDRQCSIHAQLSNAGFSKFQVGLSGCGRNGEPDCVGGGRRVGEERLIEGRSNVDEGDSLR